MTRPAIRLLGELIVLAGALGAVVALGAMLEALTGR